MNSQWEFAIRLRELKLGLHDNLERWDGMRSHWQAQEGEDNVDVWLIHVAIWQKPT